MSARRAFAVLLFSVMQIAALHAEVTLPHVFSDHAVLQRDQPVRVWGWALPGEVVRISFRDQTLTATADKMGDWQVWLKPQSAGGPFALAVTSDKMQKAITRSDILIGDVWLASGQSNMEFPMSGWANQPLKDGANEIAGADQPRIRLLHTDKVMAAYPQADVAATWTECTPETARNFSAIAYFFGREISKGENVPIGLIQSAWGGTPAHSWMSAAGIADANLDSIYRDAGQIALDVAQRPCTAVAIRT